MYNNKYILESTIYSATLCTLKLASGIEEGLKNKFALKVFKKGVLRSKKEYHRKKGGHGMVMTDQLMKVNESEVRTNLKLHEQGGHKNIAKLYEIIDDDNEADKLVLVMEYCSKKQLLNWHTEQAKFVPNPELVGADGFLPESVIKKAILDIAAGLDFMHKNGVLHRDVKP